MTISTFNGFKASDGKIFEGREEAIRHEGTVGLAEKIDALLKAEQCADAVYVRDILLNHAPTLHDYFVTWMLHQDPSHEDEEAIALIVAFHGLLLSDHMTSSHEPQWTPYGANWGPRVREWLRSRGAVL